MKLFSTVILCVLLCSAAFAQTNDIDTELSNLAQNLAAQIKGQGKTKVAVIDFTDLQGGTSGELGKYIAEQLTVDLVMDRKGFSVLDRANLKKILDEHKLTSKGLIDPDTAKKLGMFAGVDALVMGTIIPKDQGIALTAKIITTDTAEIVGAAKAEFKSDNTVQQLTNAPASSSGSDNSEQSNDASVSTQSPKIIKSFPSFAVEVDSLRVVNGGQYMVTMTLTNFSTTKYTAVGLDFDTGSGRPLYSIVSDPEGYEFHATVNDVTGVAVASMRQFFGFEGSVTKIPPHDSVQATITFSSPPGRVAVPGLCHVQLQFLAFALDGYGKITEWNRLNLIADIKAN